MKLTETKTITIDHTTYQFMRTAYNLTVCGNGYIGGKWEGWRFSGDGKCTSPDGDVFSVDFLRMIGREFAIRGTPLSRRRRKPLGTRALRQEIHLLSEHCKAD